MKKIALVLFILNSILFQSQTLKLSKSFNIGVEPVKNISISGDCKLIGASSSTQVKIWDIASGKETKLNSAKDLVCFGNYATNVITNSYSNIKTFNVTANTLQFELEGQSVIMNDSKYSPALGFIYTINENGELTVWSSAEGKSINKISVANSPLTKLAVCSSGKTLVTADINKSIHIIDLLNSKEARSIKGIEDNVKSLLFGKNDSLLYFITENNKLFRQNILSEQLSDPVYLLDAKCAAISPDGKYIAIGNSGNALVILSSDNFKAVVKTEDSKSSITDVQFGNDGKYVYTSYSSGKINSYDASSLSISPSRFYTNHYMPKVDITAVVPQKNENKNNTIVKEEVKPNTEERQMRGNGDPLKGINVANANKEIKPGKYYALIIGIDAYKGTWPALKNAVNDAKAIDGVLKAKYKFESIKTLFNEQATRNLIIGQLEWLSENVKENDNVLIYYSGHGEFKKQLNKGYWVPADATSNTTAQYISNSELQTFLGGIKSKHTLLIADACFSGDIFRGNTVSLPFENSDKYYANVYDKDSRQVMTSGGIEPVMDGGKDGHSVFAYYLLKALNGNNGKYFDSGQLFEQIKIPVINNSDQTPNFSSIQKTGDEGGHFIFIKK